MRRPSRAARTAAPTTHPRPAAPGPRARSLLPLAASALVVAAAACGGADGEAGATAAWRTVTDTVGDTVVVRTVGAADSAALARLVPEVRIGELDGDDEYQFGHVAHVLPAPGNGVYVWDQTLTTLRRYDSTGAFVRRIGARGGGPGEYEASNGMVLLPDGRLVLWDPRNTRLNVYDTAGAFVGSWRRESGLHVGGHGGLLADTAGNVYAMHWFRAADTTRQDLPGSRSGYLVLGSDGTVRDSLLPPDLGVERQSLVASSEGATSVYNVPFSPAPAWTVSPHGYVVSTVGSRYAVTLHRPGAPLRIERDVAPVAVHPDEKANSEERTTFNMRRTDPAWRWNGPAIPDTKPPVRALRMDPDGRIWVQRSAPGVAVEPEEPASTLGDPREQAPPLRWREPTVFDVFDTDGTLLGSVVLPERTEILHVRADRAWGVVRDEMDVPYVTRFRIEWPVR